MRSHSAAREVSDKTVTICPMNIEIDMSSSATMSPVARVSAWLRAAAGPAFSCRAVRMRSPKLASTAEVVAEGMAAALDGFDAVNRTNPPRDRRHVITHAFFKALLFLCSGAVLHSMHHEGNIWKMGGLARRLGITFLTFMAGTFALIGVPPFSGFFSKDEILWKAWSSPHGSVVIWGLGVLTAGLTAFYMFRLMGKTFYGESHVDPHVSTRSMNRRGR